MGSWSNGVRRSLGRLLAAIAALLAWAAPAYAHRTGESYVYLDVTETDISGRFEVLIEDMNGVMPLDTDGDGKVTEAEFTARSGEAYAELASRLAFFTGDTAHSVVIKNHTFLAVDFGTFALVHFDIPTLKNPPETIGASYRALWDGRSRDHRGYLLFASNTFTGLKENEAAISLLFTPGKERQDLKLTGKPWPEVFVEFVGHGAWHIWIGYDHMLFLLALLLPAVMRREGGAWVPSPDLVSAFGSVVKVVSLFTVAHSITLSLAALNIVQLPVWLVEAVIALSIAAAAANTLLGVFKGSAWPLVFGFGLFHGFGFANVLDPLGVNQNAQLPALAGFNIGVELGQIAVILAVFPILYLLRRMSFYRPVILQLGSAVLIPVALFWFVERTYDVLGPVTENLLGVVS